MSKYDESDKSHICVGAYTTVVLTVHQHSRLVLLLLVVASA